MSFLNNIRIKSKLLLLISIPLITILILSLYAIFDKYQMLQTNKTSKQLIEVSIKLSALVHELQKERGMSAGFLLSKGTKFATEIKTQRTQTDIKFKEFKNDLETKDIDKAIFAELLKASDAISQTRTKIDSFGIEPADAIKFYTNLNNLSLDTISNLTKTASDAEVVKNLASYVNFLQSKEKTGIERATVTGVVTTNSFGEGMYQKFCNLTAEQNSFIKSFLITANSDFEAGYKTLSNEESFKTVQDIRNTLNKSASSGNFGLDAPTVFNAYTTKINKQKAFEDTMSGELVAQIDILLSRANSALFGYIILAGLISSVVLFLGFLISSNIVNSLKTLEIGLHNLIGDRRQTRKTVSTERRRENLVDFKSTNPNKKIEIANQDEIGKIANLFNEYLDEIQKGLSKDNILIKELEQVIANVRKGFFDKQLSSEACNKDLNDVKNIINAMSNELKINIEGILQVLLKYTNDDFRNKIEIKLDGDMQKLIDGINELGVSLKQNATKALTNGKHLEANSINLQNAVTILTTSANEQAASVEETAAAMEEISSTIAANTEKTALMSTIAHAAENATKNGLALTSTTAKVMDEIKQVANSINEAITIIDSIAFQTNILSLNAAVEAATAGEAGKGFAVVAGEVRNLATRSAEAAKEIRTLTDAAQRKANEGHTAVSKMIEGFEDIYQKSKQTTEMVNDVTQANKEQLVGVKQVSEALNQIDKSSQKSADIASQAQNIANQTKSVADILVQDAARVKL